MAESEAGELAGRAPVPSQRAERLVLSGVAGCFALSGFAALLYQTAWLRQFTLVFGTSELAVVSVLAAYMAGLALGSAIAGRYVERIRRPVLCYGLLEAGVALSALAVPWLLDLASACYRALLGGQPAPPAAAGLGQPVFYLGVAFLVLSLPTALMGATLPLLTRHAVGRDRELGPKVALLYAANTAGAVAGTVATGFILLAALGLARTIWVGVAINALVFAIAAALSRRVPARSAWGGEPAAPGKPPDFPGVAPLPAREGPSRQRARSAFRAQSAWILPAMLASGAAAFVYEVLWTRLLAHVLDGSVQAFATMLAAFLSGIALGAGLAGRVAERGERAALAFAACQVAIAVLSMAVYAGIGPLLPGGGSPAGLVVYAFAVLFPAACFLGATFPLAVRILARDEREAGAVTARVYAWNTVGGIAGAVLAGFLLLPALGFGGTVKLAVCLNLSLALLTLGFAPDRSREGVAAVALALVALIALYHPGRPEAVVSNFRLVGDLAAPRELFYAVGRSATVLALEDRNRAWLFANGLPEASITTRGSAPFPDSDSWLTVLPVMARPELETMLVVGLGGGVALEALPPSVRQLDVVELEAEILNANRHLAERRRLDPLADGRIDVVINDARNALRMTGRRYDAIVSQPSHPWTAGASHLFTREFLGIVEDHLEPGGVFVQWMSSDFLTEPLLQSLAATLLEAFAEVRLYRPVPKGLFFLASDGPLAVEQELARTGRPLDGARAHYHRIGVGSLEDLVAALTADDRGLREFARGAPVINDDRNLMATQSRSRGDGLSGAEVSALFAAHDPLGDPGSFVHRQLGHTLRYSYIARRLVAEGQLARARALAEAVADPATAQLLVALMRQLEGAARAADEAARAALAASPESLEARYLLIGSRMPELAADEPPAALRDLVAGLSGPSRAVVDAFRHEMRREWAALARLEAGLARSQSTDLWFADSLRLRASWRLHVPRDRSRFAREALSLLDAVLILQDHLDLQLLRVQAAAAAGEWDAAVASALRLVEHGEGALQEAAAAGRAIADPERAEMRRKLELVARALAAGSAGRDPERAAALLARARRLDRALAAGSDRPR